MPAFRVRQLLQFIRTFGVREGTGLWLSLKLQLMRGDALSLRVPGIAAPLQLREQDLPIFDQVMVDHEIDLEAYPQFARVEQAYRALLARGKRPVILDCGGHVGFSAVWFATRFPQATVYSVEPEAGNFRLLQQNAAPYPNVVPLRGGIWSRHCQLEIVNPEAVSAAFQVRELADGTGCGAREELCGYTIEEILREHEENRLWLVKIDVEGSEAEVFRGPSTWLGDAAAMVIELHDWLLPGQGTSGHFVKRLAEHEFEMVQRKENLLLFRSETPATQSGELRKKNAEIAELELALKR